MLINTRANQKKISPPQELVFSSLGCPEKQKNVRCIHCNWPEIRQGSFFSANFSDIMTQKSLAGCRTKGFF